jgi:hypothetical protein
MALARFGLCAIIPTICDYWIARSPPARGHVSQAMTGDDDYLMR